jgi:hypothetical protein
MRTQTETAQGALGQNSMQHADALQDWLLE